MDHREKLLKIVQEKGPLLPAQVNRELNTNVLFASAMLSEMVGAKKLRLSSMKVGGSPLYYCEGQEHKLEGFAEKLDAPYLNAFKQLKDDKVLRDRDQQPVVRVSLREIKDFAVPLEVTANGSTDLFWKYYLVEDNTAKALIKKYLESRAAPKQSKKQSQATRKDAKEVQAKISSMEKVSLPEPSHGGAEQRAVELSTPVLEQSSISMTPFKEGKVPEFEYSPAFSFSTSVDTDEIVKLEKKKEDPAVEQQRALALPEGDPFFDRVRSFFDEAGIEIKTFGVVTKGRDFDFEIMLPSNIGPLKYYCKAKDKKKISEFDIHSAFVEGHVRKMPVLFLTAGEPTSKAKDVLHKELKTIHFKNLPG